ncbi:MAG TPA: twin-arginine translocation signal domain-containing protein, partial [Anaerolineales bacterium]|nr:twin-arginine translocation signal domain-containing protein [Anaerolineales bacterium]
MLDTSGQETVDVQGVTRRDFLKLCSLMIGGLGLPRGFVSSIERAAAAPDSSSFTALAYFQWQNEFLCKTIYPMREVKLRDFLIYYMEVDVWSQYKDKDVDALTNEVSEYKKAWELNAAAAQKEYASLRDYFLKADVREEYSKFQPIDEAELTEIHNLHALFVQSWPRDIRGERGFVAGLLPYWGRRLKDIRDWVNWRTRRHLGMNPSHPKYIPEGEELKFKESTTLVMAEQEMDKLRAFLATYDKIEERKLAWYKLSKSDPNFKTPEAEFLVKYPPEKQITI